MPHHSSTARTHAGNRFVDKVAIVTGGSTGIGLAIVTRLLAEGGTVVFCGRRSQAGTEALEQLESDRARFMVADVTDRDDLETLVAGCVDEFGRLDVVVNNAGNVVVGPTMNLTPGQWDKTISLNLNSVFHLCQLTIPHLRTTIASGRAHGASIVNVASLDSIAGDRGFAAYNAAKAGVVNLTRSLALEFGPEGIRVNAVSPGYIDTPLTAMTTSDPTAKAAFVATNPVGRAGRPEDVAAAVAFIAADEAGFVNGTNLVVDGGVTASTGHPDVLALFGMTET